ncbi:sensor histidine kinase [Lysinibacillus sp. NPDC097287]|uniref:sensor histidine kinase n=1 Tax=Lysinibacillus sp. NPDC097287 TaxID=3364144 RepID=UPI00382F87F8
MYFFNIYTYVKQKKQLHNISDILDEVLEGNLNRRLYANENDVTSDIAYKINDIVIGNKKQLLAQNKSEKAYKELVTSLSHDIRTPLTSLVGYLEALDRNLVTSNERGRYIQTAKNKAFSLSEYIQTLFEWLKLESGEWLYSFEKVNICEQSRVIIADWIFRFEELKINYHFDIPNSSIPVKLDVNAYERVLNNLLSNVLKHSQATQIGISITYDESRAMIKVSDNGIGISKEDLPFILNRLYKCDYSRSTSSNGLGLAIVNELVISHNGQVNVESTLNSGTTFEISLPRL